jgi:hypothetical protein
MNWCQIARHPLLAAGSVQDTGVDMDEMGSLHEKFALMKAKIKAKGGKSSTHVDALQTLPLFPEDADVPSLHPEIPNMHP